MKSEGLAYQPKSFLFARRCYLRPFQMLAVWAVLLVIGSRSSPQTTQGANEPEPQPVAKQNLRQELLARMEKDQSVRKKLMKRNKADAELKEMMKVDRDNIAWLEEVVDRHGWPGKALVGDDGAHAAWLLVQHADLEPAFQKKCLGLLTTAVEKKDASAQDMAYLTDRVRVAEKKPQVYGTQFDESDGKLVLKPIEDEEHVDERRKEVGLSPLREYLKAAEAFYLQAKDEP